MEGWLKHEEEERKRAAKEAAKKEEEEFKNTVKKTRGACAEYCRRVLVTYNRCQVVAEQILDAIPEHELFTELLQRKYQEDE